MPTARMKPSVTAIRIWASPNQPNACKADTSSGTSKKPIATMQNVMPNRKTLMLALISSNKAAIGGDSLASSILPVPNRVKRNFISPNSVATKTAFKMRDTRTATPESINSVDEKFTVLSIGDTRSHNAANRLVYSRKK